jgi:hypothetical protein
LRSRPSSRIVRSPVVQEDFATVTSSPSVRSSV